MTLKLSTPSNTEAETPPQLLSDILMNEQLFEVFHGKSLILQAEVKVEKDVDGSPKSMIVSGQVPVSLSKGFRNGKPTREIRVRGHLRRKLSSKLTVNAFDSLNRSDQLGRQHSRDWKVEDRNGTDRKKEQQEKRKTVGDQPLRPLEQAEFQTSSPFPTYSKLRLSRLEKNKDWNAGEHESIDKKLSSENQLQENPTEIANWSPYFDCGSPMSGQTVRGSRQFEASWDLREKTPTPRFSSAVGRGNHLDEGRKQSSTEQLSSKKLTRGGDWTPFIGIASSSASNSAIAKTEPLKNKSDTGGPKWNPQVNKCTLVEDNRGNSVENKEGENNKDLDHFGLCVARSESVIDAVKEGKVYYLSNNQVHDDGTQTTNERRRIEISKISHQVGQKLSHLKEMVMRPKMNSENANNVNKADKHDTNEIDSSNLSGKQLDTLTRQKEDEDVARLHYKSSGPKSVRIEGAKPRKTDHSDDDFRGSIDREMVDKLLQGRETSGDRRGRITRKNGDERSTDNENEDGFSDKKTVNLINRQNESKMVQARESSIDQYLHITKNKSDCDKVKKVHGHNEGPRKDEAIDSVNNTRSTRDQFTQATWRDGDLQKDHDQIRHLYDPNSFVYSRNKALRNLNSEGNHLNHAKAESPRDADKLVEHEEKVKLSVDGFRGPQNVYKYAADKLNSSVNDQFTAGTLFTTRDLPKTKNPMNPIVAITISRSRTKLFRFNNGLQYEEKEGAQFVTVEAPKGLFYSSV